MATNGVVKFSGSTITQGPSNLSLFIFKNSSYYATVVTAPSLQNTAWVYVDPVPPTITDYYQLYYTNTSARVTLSASTNNWWYGEVMP